MDADALVIEFEVGVTPPEAFETLTEYDWGSVIDWQTPTRLRYRRHLFFDPSEATEVDVLFTARGAEAAVRLEQSGWERLGAQGPPRRAKTAQAWSALTATFARALATA